MRGHIRGIPLAVGVAPGGNHALHGGLQVLQGGLDLVGVRGAGLLHGGGEDEHGVIALGGGHGGGDAVHVVGLVVAVDEGLRLGRDGLLDEGLGHEGAVAVLAGVVDVVGHGQGPAADEGRLHADLGHAVGDGGQLGADGPDQDGLGAGGLGPQQLGGHVLVADVELLLGHDLELVALRLDLAQDVVPA